MGESILEISDLGIVSDAKSLVNGISFSIKEQSVLGLVGESGSGKTLTALSILGLLPTGVRISSGNITYASKTQKTNLLSCSEKELNRIRGNQISMIFQEPLSSLNPSMRCGQQAMEILRIKEHFTPKKARQRIMELFSEVQLSDAQRIFNAWPHELSGGQRQRVMIAMSLSASPDLLIADEPTTALDVTVQKSILELLSQLKDKFRLSILFITHDLLLLNQFADEIVVMYDGRIMEAGDKNNIMSNPASTYTKGLLACKPTLNTNTERLPVIADFTKNAKSKSSTIERKPAPPHTEILMSVNNMKVSFPHGKNKVIAVKNISFDVHRGETLGLVGESGCGKTTLGRSILQLIQSKSGTVTYHGKVLENLSVRELRNMRKNLQLVFQDPFASLNPGMTVGSILAEPLLLHKIVTGKKNVEEKIMDILEQVGLPSDCINNYPHQFSGGQRQRIGIARALASNPEFIILDESVSALDVSVQAQILNLLNDLKEKFQLTYIFISHDLTVVKYMSDRVIVMAEGEIVESGDAITIYHQPQHPYTKKLIEAIPV